MRLAYYAGASTAAAAACLLKAFHERPNFYSATVYLSQSNACLLILTNLCLVLSCTFIYALQRLLYGPLRPIEIEQLSEKAWYAVLDTLLAMPSFREDVGGWLLAMFTLLLAGKVWGWIGEGKVDVLEQQPPANPKLFHARLATSLVVSVGFDLCMLDYCVETVLADPRPGMMVIFCFEFAILSVSSTFTLARYGLSLIQSRIEKQQMAKAISERKAEIRAERFAARQNETSSGQPAPASPPNDDPIEVDENEVDVPGWEEKRRYLFALEVFTDFIKLLIYIVFFTVSITFNGLPMHIMRDVYMTFASFSKRVADYVAYRKATQDMNSRYPDATTEEIRGDACIVCRETMVAWEQTPAAPAAAGGQAGAQPAEQQPAAAPTPARRRDEGLRAKKLPCGHILHLRCLKAWLERQQVCPTCRRPVVTATAPAVPGQPGAAGGNNAGARAAPGQGQAAPPVAPNRARILNFGPIRIGFLNGPGDQIGNIVRQMQNQNNQNQQQGGQGQGQNAAGGGQQGPNHLGLQVPYVGGQAQQQQQGAGAGAGAADGVSTQLRITQLEQRILQDAHNLGIEQQQLGTLRMMDGELQRLRNLRQQPGANGANGVNAQPTQRPPIPQPPMYANPMQPFMPFYPPQQGYAPIAPPAQALQGHVGQQMGSGHESLPAGMVVPEGWSVMPLQRADQEGVPRVVVQGASGGEPSTAAGNGGAGTGSGAAPADPTQVHGSTAAAANGEQQQLGSNGPTDDSGSPLFVPATAPTTNGENAAPLDTESETQWPERASSLEVAPAAPLSQTPTVQNPPPPPWSNTQNSWSFPQGEATDGDGEQPQPSTAEQPPPPEHANGGPPESREPEDNGKGKGKAAEVEDAPDTGD